MSGNKNTYVGITVGPIQDTLRLASSPAALWAASYLFSSLTRVICEILTEEYGVAEHEIVSPYYRKNDALLNRQNGVGLFHDRILFRADRFEYAAMEDIRAKAIAKIAAQFGLEHEIAYLQQYLCIAYARFQAENPISGSAQLLDCLELAKPFVFCQEHNPLIGLFTNSNAESTGKAGRNRAVKALTTGFSDFQLRKYATQPDSPFKSLEDIARTGTDYKRYRYYAVVRADGDSMHKITAALPDDSSINAFSKTCLGYCAAVADAVNRYDGVTVYAGGDDLLAILPCESKTGSSVFEFLAEVNTIFEQHLKNTGLSPATLSFGVSIAYYKTPLYEALADSSALLFGTAKSIKNCTAIRLRKNTGQAEGLVISNDHLAEYIGYLHQALGKDANALLAVLHRIALFQTSFEHANDQTTIQNLFINLFETSSRKQNAFARHTLPAMLWSLKTQTEASGIYPLTEQGILKANTVQALLFILRIFHFFVEKDGDYV